METQKHDSFRALISIHPEKGCLNNERWVQERLRQHLQAETLELIHVVHNGPFPPRICFSLWLGVNNHPNIVDTEVRGYCAEWLCLLFELSANFSEKAAGMWRSSSCQDLTDLALEWLVRRQDWTCGRLIQLCTTDFWLQVFVLCVFLCAPHTIQYWPTLRTDLQEPTTYNKSQP